MGMAVKGASQGRYHAFACFEYALGTAIHGAEVSIRALHNCLDAQPVTVVDASLNPSNDAILDKRFGYACSDEKNWISRDLSWNKYPEVYDICLYAGVVWIVRIELLDDFRFSSPSICFAVKIYYPNIDFE
ncbi:ubiquitin-conjugating enzyme E2 4 [Tanacetum coccineum]